MAKYNSKEEIAEVAAKWWVDRISFPRFNMGATSNSEAMCEIMATVLAAKNAPNEDVVSKFSSIFKEKLLERMDKEKHIMIEVDYAPDMFLGDVMRKAGVSISLAPWKTCMTIDMNNMRIRAKHGYGDNMSEI